MYFGLRPVAVKINGVLFAVHTDYLGTPRVVTTAVNGGSVVWQWKNDNPYGNNQAQGSIEFNLRFAGQYYDYESGLHYNMNRTYNPETGRYLQSDPLGLAAGLNTYNYVNKNPLDGVDPLGLLGISATNNPIISEAIHNPISVPKGSLGIGGHSNTNRNNVPGFNIEANSELYEYIKLRNPDLILFQSGEDVSVAAEGLANLLERTFNLYKYDKIYLESCRLGKLTDSDGIIFAQKLSNLLGKPVVAYTEYTWAEKKNDSKEMAKYTGYTTSALYNQGPIGRSISSSSYHESPNAKDVEVTFYPQWK